MLYCVLLLVVQPLNPGKCKFTLCSIVVFQQMFGHVSPDACSCGLPAVVVGSHLKNSSFVLTFLKEASLNSDPIDTRRKTTQDPWDTSCHRLPVQCTRPHL